MGARGALLTERASAGGVLRQERTAGAAIKSHHSGSRAARGEEGISVGGDWCAARRVTTCNLFSTAALEVQAKALFGIQSSGL